MAKRGGYRRTGEMTAEESPAQIGPSGGGKVTRWTCAGAFAAMVFLVMVVVAGNYAKEALITLVWGIFPTTVFSAAGMLGLAMTEAAAKRGVFETSAMPRVWRAVVSVALGLGALALVTFALGALGMLKHAWVAGAVLLGFAAVGVVSTRRFFAAIKWEAMRERVSILNLLLAASAAVPVAMMLLAAEYPPGTIWRSEGRAYDVQEYHLQLPREYVDRGSIAPLAHNVYSYLPANVEMIYMLQMQVARAGMGGGSHLEGVFPAAFLHVGMMLLTAAALWVLPVPVSVLGRAIGAIFFLGVPWTMVTGSLAYNEGGMLLWGVAAAGMAMRSGVAKRASNDTEGRTTPARMDGACAWAMVLTGVFLGLAVGAKLTAGVMFAIPVALMLVARGRWKGPVWVGLIACVVFLPWGVRAAIGSGGNPFFPIAAKTLGKDGWTLEQVDRWDRGHAATEKQRGALGRIGALGDQSIFDGQWGYGAASMQAWMGEKPGESRAAKFGFLWAVIVPLVVVSVLPRGERKPPLPEGAVATAWIFAGMLGLQVVFWVTVTHLQARFLLPCAVPLAVLIGLGLDALRGAVWKTLAVGAVLTQAAAAVFILLPEVGLLLGDERSEAAKEQLPQMLGILYPWEFGGKDSPEFGKRVCMIGDPTVLFHNLTPVYATVFDDHPFIAALRSGGPEAAARFLREQPIDLLIINWGEVGRLRRTYGFDAAVTHEAVEEAATRAGMVRDSQFVPGVERYVKK